MRNIFINLKKGKGCIATWKDSGGLVNRERVSAAQLKDTVVTESIQNDNKFDNLPYVFPITPESLEWKKFTTKKEMLDVCQIPEEKLHNMSTSALLETVLNYPFIDEYIAYNSVKDACEAMSREFNGFNELFSRGDVTDEILKNYEAVEVATTEGRSVISTNDFFMPAAVEYLIVCDEIKNGKIVGDEQTELKRINKQKRLERAIAGIYSAESDVYDTYSKNEKIATFAAETWVLMRAGTVKTPKGNNVPEVYVESKWGPYGVYQHPENYCPYTPMIEWYTVN